jgi:hypothetical protein
MPRTALPTPQASRSCGRDIDPISPHHHRLWAHGARRVLPAAHQRDHTEPQGSECMTLRYLENFITDICHWGWFHNMQQAFSDTWRQQLQPLSSSTCMHTYKNWVQAGYCALSRHMQTVCASQVHCAAGCAANAEQQTRTLLLACRNIG